MAWNKECKNRKYDARHEMVQIIADEVKKANVGYRYSEYIQSKSLYKPREQWKPMTTGQLDITAFPLAYAAKFHPEFRYYFDAWNC